MLALIAGRDPTGVDEGHASYVRAHAVAAARAGYRPEIFFLADHEEVTSTELGTLHPVRAAPGPRRQLLIGAQGPRLARAVAQRAAGGREPTVIHAFGVWGYAGVRARDLLRRQGQRAAAVVSSYTTHRAESASQVRGLGAAPLARRASFCAQAVWSRLVVSRYERHGYAEADAVLANYRSVRELIRRAHGDRIDVRLVPYGLTRDDDPGDARPQEPPAELAPLEPPEAPLVVCVASHHPRKGIDVLLEALAELRRRGSPMRAALIGQGPMLEHDRALAAALGLGPSLTFLPRVAEVEPYLRAADMFVLPAREEQSGSVAVLEALRVGAPVIASGVDGITEDLVDRRSGLLTVPGDRDSLADAIAELAGDAELRRRLGAGGRERFRARFGTERFSAELAAVYSELGLPSA